MGNDPWNVWFGPGPGTVAARRRPTPKRVDLHKAISDAKADDPSTVTCRCARCDTEVILTAIAYDSFRFSSMDILCERHLDALREPLAMTKAEAQLIGIQPGPLPSPLAIASTDARMIRWLTGVGEFDTNDPCDEWPAP